MVPPLVMEPIYDEYEGLGLATLLVREGHMSEARLWIENLNSKHQKSGLAKYLLGRVALDQKEYSKAETLFQNALAMNLENFQEEALEFLAQTYQLQGKNQDCLNSLEGLSLQANPRRALLSFECHSRLGNINEALGALRASHENDQVRLQEIEYLLSLGLNHEAFRIFLEVYEQGRAFADHDVLKIQKLFENLKSQDLMWAVLEVARLVHSDKNQIRMAWVQAAYARGYDEAVANELSLLAQAGDPNLGYAAAEALRMGGKTQRAQAQIQTLKDPEQKNNTTKSLWVDQSRWALLASKTSLDPTQNIKDEDAYAAAYAWTQVGDSRKAIPLLMGIKKASLSRKKEALLKLIQNESTF